MIQIIFWISQEYSIVLPYINNLTQPKANLRNASDFSWSNLSQSCLRYENTLGTMGDDLFEKKVRELESIMNFAFENQKLSDKKKRLKKQRDQIDVDSEMNTSIYEDLEILLPNFKVSKQSNIFWE